MTRAAAVISAWGVLWLTPGMRAQETLSYCQEWNTEEFFRTATAQSVKACLEVDADPMARNESEETPLHLAAQHSKAPGVIEALLAAGAHPNAEATNKWTPLHTGAESGNLVAIQALLDAGADVEARTDWSGMSPLHWAAESGNLAVIQALLAAGAELEAVGRGGVTPLWMAVRVGNVESIRALLAAGADPMKPVWGGDSASTPLELAEYGIDVLVEPKRSAVLELLRGALKTAGQACNLWNTKRFFQAATPESVAGCMETGADPVARDSWNITPLHWAAGFNGYPAVLQALLEAGADVEARDNDGDTPLHWAT